MQTTERITKQSLDIEEALIHSNRQRAKTKEEIAREYRRLKAKVKPTDEDIKNVVAHADKGNGRKKSGNGKRRKGSRPKQIELAEQEERGRDHEQKKQRISEQCDRELKRLRQQTVFEWVKLTPEKAQQWICDGDAPQRNLDRAWVLSLADDIRGGRWNPQVCDPIVFDDKSNRVNGKHRCAAVIDADLAVVVPVLYGVSGCPLEQDDGRGRSFADQLKMEHAAYYKDLATTTRLVALYEGRGSKHYWMYGGKISKAKLRDTLKRNPRIRDAVGATCALHGIREVDAVSRLAFVRFLTQDKHPGACIDFFEKLATGANCEADEPVVTLRNALLRNKGASRKAPRAVTLAWIVKSWNAHIQGRRISTLKWTQGSDSKERFPEVL